jgi:hypothetical protein
MLKNLGLSIVILYFSTRAARKLVKSFVMPSGDGLETPTSV